jgi:hypothetical protein
MYLEIERTRSVLLSSASCSPCALVKVTVVLEVDGLLGRRGDLRSHEVRASGGGAVPTQ